MARVQNLLLLVNASKPQAGALADRIEGIAGSCGVRVVRTSAYPLPGNALEGFDLCCTVGGDGTLLGTVEAAARAGVPVLGVNCGKLGFITAVEGPDFQGRVEGVLRQGFAVSSRTLLSCRGRRDRPAWLALNDIVLRNHASRLCQFDVHTEAGLLNHYVCDGIILSTPTGSTAYNLSAGGPIIHPQARVVALTPICPHTLSNRSVVVGDETCLEVRIPVSGQPIQVSVDGTETGLGWEDFPLRISIAAERFDLVCHEPSNHFERVRHKLGW